MYSKNYTEGKKETTIRTTIINVVGKIRWHMVKINGQKFEENQNICKVSKYFFQYGEK